MKKMISLLLAAALLPALLSACQKTSARSGRPGRQPSASEVVNAMLPAAGYTGQSGNLEYLTTEDEDADLLAIYLENAYGLSDGVWEDAAIIRAAGASAFELAVLRLENGTGASLTAALLESYLNNRRGDFAGYAPEQAEMVANADIAREGAYAALCICPDPDQAAEAFRKAIKGSGLTGFGIFDFMPPPAHPTDRADPSVSPIESPSGSETPGPLETQYVATYPGRCDYIQPNIDDMSIYDTSAILTAWERDDPASLSSYDREIYDAAQEVLDTVLRDGMSDLEKETAIYYWIVNNVNYDWTHQDVMIETPREAFTPYGGLVKRQDPYDRRMKRSAVCLGYATTFQLLMDMAGVECITVVGAAYYSGEDHGWNMVRLNGNWYCVDVTWDANYREFGYSWGQESEWIYFNITSDEMAMHDHQWDYANVPEAVTRGNGRY